MRRHARTVLGGVAAVVPLVAGLAAQPVVAQPAADQQATATARTTARSDDLVSPQEAKRRALRQEALTRVIDGAARAERRGPSTVVKLTPGARSTTAPGRDQYVELGRETTDHVFVILVEFGDKRDPRFPDKDIEPSTPSPVRFDGPLHNQIPEPDRTVDNTTVWQPDYDRQHYQDLYFGSGGRPGSGGAVESVRQYYERQSSGRYSIDGTITDWVKVPYNEARYGRSSDNPATNGDDPEVCADVVCSNTEDLVRDAANRWYAAERAKGRSRAEVAAELRSMDTWDRYDVDGDGDFNEPDGYLDHFQIVHAGGDEADRDPIFGEDAIWSHRAYVYATDSGRTGPVQGKQGGTQVGGSGVWIGDYTMQPENGGMSVFAHEYGHDLGLPDLYDTDGGENSVNWWSLMAQSRQSAPGDQAIGTRASDFGAWDKLFLGWLDYETVLPAQDRRIELGPHEYNSAKAQAAVVVLPQKEVTTELVEPYAGERDWWSGTGNDYTATMTRRVTVPSKGGTFSARANYNMEQDYDYAYVEVRPTGSSTWVSIPGTGTDPGQNNSLTGDTAGEWVPVSFGLLAYRGTTIDLRVRYTTDGAVQGNDPDYPPGLFLDQITLPDGFTDGAESGSNGWTLSGFSAVGAATTGSYDQYYVASNRVYTSFDAYLRSGPYHFVVAGGRKVEHFPYQDGLLISYWDTSQSDNNTSTHPGQGLILPVDANPRPLVRLDGALWRPRVGGYDAPFGLHTSDSFTLTVDGIANYIRGQAAVPVFRDDRSYWDPSQPSASVKVPDTGTQIRMLSQDGTSMAIRVSPTRGTAR